MRSTKVVSISLPLETLAAAQLIAREEQRTMSELMREALRAYQRERREWDEIFALAAQKGREAGVRTEQDVVRIIRSERRKRTRAAAKGVVSGK